MNEERLAEVLSNYTDGVARSQEAFDLTEEESRHLAPLFQLSEHLQRRMQPVEPSTAFVHSLRDELVEEARKRMAFRERIQRLVMIGAAALGSILSIVSVVGVIILLVKWLRARSPAHRAPTTHHASAG